MSTNLETNEHDSFYSAATEPLKTVLFVFNPVSGKSQIRFDLIDILQILSNNACVVTCYPTKCQGDARNVVRSRQGNYDYVFCAGGDGTLDEVVTGMMESAGKKAVPIGYIPAGTTNDFASSLGIPSDMKEAARVAAKGRVFHCDLGRINNDTYFTYVAAFGVFTESSYETPQDLKNLLGHMAYVFQGVMDLGKLRTYHFSVEADKLSISDEFVFGMITNSKSVGGIMDITGGRVDMSDGLFEVTLIKMPANILELGEIVQYLSGAIDTSDFVYQFKTSRIVMESPEPVKWTRDGEYGGSYKRIEITNLHQAMEIIVPRDK